MQLSASREPLIVGLFDRLPEPGSAWNEEEREKWLRAAEAIFELL